MGLEQAVGLVALAWLVGALALMARLIQTGRRLAADLAARHPETYERLGRPRPGYLYSARRSRFSQLVAHREFEDLGDPVLAARFEGYRRSEARLLAFLLVSLALVFVLALVAGHEA